MKSKGLLLIFIIALCFTSCNSSETTTNNNQNKENVTINVDEITESEDIQEIEYFTVTKDTPMENRGLLLEIIGSAVYDKIEGEDFTDIPSKGKKYLILYLSIKNTSGKDEYLNYNNIITKLDGVEINDTFLINDSKGYANIKTNIPTGLITQGYLVWEVPENWEKLEVTYTGWTPTHYTEPTIIITPEDLEEPEEYKEDNRII